MDNLGEMRTALQGDLSVNSGSTLFNPTLLDLAINRSYRKSAGLFKWDGTEDAKKTGKIAGQDYYDNPENWRPYSLFRLEVDGEQYGEDPDGSPMAFPDYLIWKRDNPNSTDKKWAIQAKRYFFSPAPTTSDPDGTFSIHIWGQKVVDKLVNDLDTTIFSYSMPECNEAVVLEAGAILKGKTDEQNSEEFRSTEAKGILARAWQQLEDEQSKLEKTQPAFYVPDFFRRTTGRTNTPIGDF